MNHNDQKSGIYDQLTNTIKSLYSVPSDVIESFIDGNRGRFMNPFLYVAVTALVLATIASFTISFPEMSVTVVEGEAAEELDVLADDQRLEEFREVLEVVGVMMNTQFLGFLNFLFIPILALSSMLFFRREDSGFYRHLILNTYAVGQANLTLLLMIPVWMLFNSQIMDASIHLYPAVFLMALILLMVYNRVLHLDNMIDWLKACSALILGYFGYSLVAGLVTAIVAFLTFLSLAVASA